MINQGELYCRRGIKYFDLGQYEQAVLDWIAAYEAGYERKMILESMYECFIRPNEEEFQENYAENIVGISQLPYQKCALDFIPVSDMRFYIFDREERVFCGLFEMEDFFSMGKETRNGSVLYTDTWDIREICSDMKENGQNVLYLVLEGVEEKFMSFCKLPHFRELYLKNITVFQDEMQMRSFFEEKSGWQLPQKLVTLNAERYSAVFQELCRRKVEESRRWMARADMHPMKHQIKNAAERHAGIEEISRLAEAYEAEQPMDFDLYVLKSWILLQKGEFEGAYHMIQAGIRKNPYNYVANQMARMVCRETKRYAEAVKHDCILFVMKDKFPYLPPVEPWRVQLELKMKECLSEAASSGNQKELEQLKKEVRYLRNYIHKCFGLADYAYFGGVEDLIGKEYRDIYGNRKYNAFYDDIGLEGYISDAVMAENPSWWLTKLECREVMRTKHLTLDTGVECLLPVLQEKNDSPYQFILPDGKMITCRNKKAQHFEYYRLPSGTQLDSEEELCIGSPVVLKHNPANKKIVLNIFVDGISQRVIEEERLKNLMPYTYDFFSKGVQCTNVYTSGEWTLPVLASYVTGVSTTEHMLLHNILTYGIPEDIPVLAEYFKGQGYQTAKIDGDWRSTQTYGYGRGVDRIIYQHQNIGMRAEQIVADVLDHMKLMKETNQYIWMGCGDLHDVADGYSLRPSVQAGIPLDERADESIGITSVKQSYSRKKRAAYILQMKHIDEYLAHIYRYLEEMYRDDEMVVSLFGDHGQGYLVEEGAHFLSEGRTKVAMMFRGKMEKTGICDEVLSICDYLPILCRLAGIPLKNKKIDGNLPAFFGGEKEREYAITESIHPGDPYQAAIVSKECTYYFTAGGIVEYDGRFELGEYSHKLLDKEGKESGNLELTEYYYNLLRQHIGSLLIY